MIIYIDDMIIAGKEKFLISNLKRRLFQKFVMKDLRNLKCFLSIEVSRSKELFINQRKYIPDILADAVQ